MGALWVALQLLLHCSLLFVWGVRHHFVHSLQLVPIQLKLRARVRTTAAALHHDGCLVHILWQFVDINLLYRCRPSYGLRYLPILHPCCGTLDSCTWGCLSSNVRDVSIRTRIHVDRHYFCRDIRLGWVLSHRQQWGAGCFRRAATLPAVTARRPMI